MEYGLRPTFRNELNAAIAAADAAADSAVSHVGQRAAATGGLFDAARRGMSLSRKLNSIVQIRYADDPAKLAAWTVASHLERLPRRAAATNPTPTP